MTAFQTPAREDQLWPMKDLYTHVRRCDKRVNERPRGPERWMPFHSEKLAR